MLCSIFLLSVIFVGLPHSRGIEIGEYDSRYGTYVGPFLTLMHDVSGDLYAADNITIYIRGFNYDGEAPDAYFFAGNRTPKPSHRGFIIPNEKKSTDVLGPYRNKNFSLKFPITRKKGQRSFSDIKWISVWCRKFAIDFGYVTIPSKLRLPNPENAGSLTSNDGMVQSSNVIMEDSETITVEDFSYDGSVPDAIFVMGSGYKNSDGHQIPNERGSVAPLGKYNRKNLSLKLPKSSKGTHIQYFGIWSPTEGMITSVTFPHDMRAPPSLNSL